jgi:hypothetical protein
MRKESTSFTEKKLLLQALSATRLLYDLQISMLSPELKCGKSLPSVVLLSADPPDSNESFIECLTNR